jgi:hypothetical protein
MEQFWWCENCIAYVRSRGQKVKLTGEKKEKATCTRCYRNNMTVFRVKVSYE